MNPLFKTLMIGSILAGASIHAHYRHERYHHHGYHHHYEEEPAMGFSKAELESMHVDVEHHEAFRDFFRRHGGKRPMEATTVYHIIGDEQYKAGEEIPPYWVASKKNAFEPQELVLVPSATKVRKEPDYIFGVIIEKGRRGYLVQIRKDANEPDAIMEFMPGSIYKYMQEEQG